jgi:hypothetical protein
LENLKGGSLWGLEMDFTKTGFEGVYSGSGHDPVLDCCGHDIESTSGLHERQGIV